MKKIFIVLVCLISTIPAFSEYGRYELSAISSAKITNARFDSEIKELTAPPIFVKYYTDDEGWTRNFLDEKGYRYMAIPLSKDSYDFSLSHTTVGVILFSTGLSLLIGGYVNTTWTGGMMFTSGIALVTFTLVYF